MDNITSGFWILAERYPEEFSFPENSAACGNAIDY